MKLVKKIALISFVLALFSFNAKEEKVRVLMAGDSTMKTYNLEKTPMRGWGQMISNYFDDNVEFFNYAHGGKSTKSFRAEGYWDELMQNLRAGDIVFIQFGHNDGSKNKPERYTTPDEYKQNLIQYVKEVRAKKALPVLCTSIVMRKFVDGKFKDGHGLYPVKMREVANEMDVLLLDIHKETEKLIVELGEQQSIYMYMHLEPGDHPRFPEGREDNTHLKAFGADMVAQCAVREIQNNKIKRLIKHLRKL